MTKTESKRISKGAQARSFQAWRFRTGWPLNRAWPISNADCQAEGLPHQGFREKARRRHQSETLRFEGNREERRFAAQMKKRFPNRMSATA